MRTEFAPILGLAAAVCIAAGTVRAATFTVTTTADSGVGSLRQALTDANNGPGPDLIDFAPALAGMTIAPTAPLPILNQPNGAGTTIDADINDDCVPDINLSGASGPAGIALSVGPLATGVTVRGLAIHSYAGSALNLSTGGAVITCNHFGTNIAGTAVLPVGGMFGNPSIVVTGSGNVIGPNNLIVNGANAGVRVNDNQSPGYPDFVGLSSDSTPRVYATLSFSENCGSFSGSGFTPVDASGVPFTDNFGMRLRGRITVGASGNYTFSFAPPAGLDDNARLRIDGVTIADLTSQSPPQVVNLSAGAHAIEFNFREFTGSSRFIPAISGPGSIALSSDDQMLCPVGQPGLCAELFQLRVGSTGNRITRNRMRDNAGPGIALGFCSPNVNDPGDADVGPNNLLNHPVITSLGALGGDFNVIGTAPPNSTVDLFQAAPDPTGFGEGTSFLATTTASAGGNFSIVTTAAASGALTATATDAGGNTSEFGRNFVYTTGASRLYAQSQSAGSILLTWVDPNLIETGFRVERSVNGTTFAPIATLGANATSHLDSTGLSAATLYYYRVIATTAGGDAPASNRATASTFPASAAQVCFQRIDKPAAFALNSSVAWDGTAWAVAWSERDFARDNIDLVFQRFDATTLAPLGSVVSISDADMHVVSPPRMAWNGNKHGLIWAESVRGAAGAITFSPLFFASLDVNGQRVRGNVRLPVPQPFFEPTTLAWDGTHWGVIGTTTDDDPATGSAFLDVYLLRLDEDGRAAGAPVLLTSTQALSESPVSAAWSSQRGQYGVAFWRGRDRDYDVMFQRFTAAGVPVDGGPVLLESASFASGAFGFGSLSVVWDGTAWAVAFARDDPTNLVETAVFLRRVDATTGLPLGAAAVRISDDAPDASDLTTMLSKPGGGFALFASSLGLNNQLEVTRMQATAAGLRDGARIFVSPNDGVASQRASVGGNGSDYLVVYSPANAAVPSELYAVRVAANGLSPPQAPVTLTSGHEPLGGDISRAYQTVPLGAGFVGAWTEGAVNAPRISVRIWNGAGQIVSTLTPLTATSTRGVYGLVGVGNSFALAWKNANNDVIFARYNASGGSITGERTLATAVGGGGNITLGWNGESYAVFYASAAGGRYLRVDDAGNAIGTPVSVRGLDASNSVQWIGDSWALVTRMGAAPGGMDYLRLSPEGALLDGPVALTTPVFPGRGANAQQLHYSGSALGLIWTDWRGFDPPSSDVFFTVLERNGSKVFPEIVAFGGAFGDNNPRLYSVGANFRAVANGFGFASGMREIEITPTGTILPFERYIGNRTSGIGAPAITFNGATTASFYFASGQQHLYYNTTACLADTTPPPCPTLATTFASGAVQNSWNAVTDPGSGVIRYLLYRDGLPLAENDADVLSYADGGFDAMAANTYQVRALNGAFVESVGCPVSVPNLNAPTLVAPANQRIVVSTATGALPVTVGDVETPAANLVLTGVSSNTALVPNANIVFGGSGANRTVTITPVAAVIGSTTITLTVNDGTRTTEASFILTVVDELVFANGFEG